MTKSTGIFAAVAVGFLAYVYLVEYKGTQEKEEQKAEASKILNYKIDDVQSFTIDKNGAKMQIDRSADGWVLSAPMQDKAGRDVVEGFLNTLLDEKSDGSAAEGNDINWAIYGLDIPKASLDLKLKDKTVSMSLGSVTGVAGKHYVRLGTDNKVLMVGGTVETELGRTARDFRDKTVFRIDAGKISKVIFKDVTLVKENGTRVAEGAYKADSDHEGIQNFVSSLVAITASDFPSEEKNKFSLGSTMQKGEIHLDDGSKIQAQIYKVKEKYYLTLQDKNTVYEVNKFDFERFASNASHFRDKKRPFQFEESAVSQIDYKVDDFNLSLKKEGENWAATNVKDPIDTDKVKDLLRKLRNLEVQKFYGKSSAGMYRAKGAILLKDQTGGTVLDFKWGNDDTKNNVTVVKTNKHEELFGISNTIVPNFPGRGLIKAEAGKGEKHGEGDGHESHTH